MRIRNSSRARRGGTLVLPGDSLSYPLGANGFVFRRADLESVKADGFSGHACGPAPDAKGKREWLRFYGSGVHHFYVQTLGGFVQKRRRATVDSLRVQEEAKTNWMKEKPPVPFWLAGVYCVTFVGPIWHTVRGLVRDRDACWLWHVPASLGSEIGVRLGGVDLQTARQGQEVDRGIESEADLEIRPAAYRWGAIKTPE